VRAPISTIRRALAARSRGDRLTVRTPCGTKSWGRYFGRETNVIAKGSLGCRYSLQVQDAVERRLLAHYSSEAPTLAETSVSHLLAAPPHPFVLLLASSGCAVAAFVLLATTAEARLVPPDLCGPYRLARGWWRPGDHRHRHSM
jgi:hypothetical protein